MAGSVMTKPLREAVERREPMTDDELAVLAVIRKHLYTGRMDGASAILNFKIQLKQGGVAGQWTTIEVRDK